MISGGEPTIDPGLPAFITAVKEFGLQVKLDSNGLAPGVIAALLQRQLLDYVAIDVKTSLARYGELHSGPVNVTALRETVRLLKEAEVETEFRTTCIPGLVDEAEIEDIGYLLSGAGLWVLQQYVPEHAMAEEWRQFTAYPPERLQALAEQAGAYVAKVQIRGL